MRSPGISPTSSAALRRTASAERGLKAAGFQAPAGQPASPSDTVSTSASSADSAGSDTEPKAVGKSEPAKPTAFWSEAQSLGLLPTSAAVGGPLGAVLSATARQGLGSLIGELQNSNIEFYRCWNPDYYHSDAKNTLSAEEVQTRILESEYDEFNARHHGRFGALVVNGPGMKAVPIHDLHDLRALQAFATGEVDQLPQPELGQHLLDLQAAGYQTVATERATEESYFEQARNREVGAFGAYRALREQAPDERFKERLFVKGRTGVHQISSPEDYAPVAYFALGENKWTGADELARSMRELTRDGYTFHFESKSYQVQDPLTVWKRIQDWDGGLQVGVRGFGPRAAKKGQLQNPEWINPSVLALGEFYAERIKPLQEQGEVSEREADLMVRILSFEPAVGTLAQRFEALGQLCQLERELQPELDSTKNLGYAGGALRDLLPLRQPDEELPDLLADYSQIRRQVPPGVAVKTLEYFRYQLPARVVSQEDAAEQKRQILDLAHFATSFAPVEAAQDLVATDSVGEPYEARLAVMRSLTEANAGLPAEEVGMFDKKDPMAQACDDYRLLLRWKRPDQTLSEAATELLEVHSKLVKPLGYSSSREAYIRFQKLSRSQPELTVNEFLVSMQTVLSRLAQFEEPEKPFSLDDKKQATEFHQDYAAILSYRRADQSPEDSSASLARCHTLLSLDLGRPLSREVFASFQRSDRQDLEAYLAEQSAHVQTLSIPFPDGHPELALDFQAASKHRFPDRTMAASVKALSTIQNALIGEATPEQGRNLYIRLTDEFQQGVFADRDPDEVLKDFLKNYSLHGDHRKAYALTRFTDVNEEDVEFGEGSIVIGDIELPLDF